MKCQTIRTYKIQGETKHHELCRQELWSQVESTVKLTRAHVESFPKFTVILGYKHGRSQSPQL